MKALKVTFAPLPTFGNHHKIYNKYKLYLNPCGADPVHRRDFRKILPFLLKSRFLLLSLHLYTKWICGFDSPLNFEETGAKKVSLFFH